MPTKNHKHSMSNTERAFWRQVFLVSPNHTWGLPSDLETEVKRRTEFANAAVEAYRKTVTWRQS